MKPIRARLAAGSLFATEMIARMYGSVDIGQSETKLERATRNAVHWMISNTANLIRITPVFSVRFTEQVSKTLKQISDDIRR